MRSKEHASTEASRRFLWCLVAVAVQAPAAGLAVAAAACSCI